jgi:predicted Co/Zn/Cd cation transporter (cation efflux family)
MTGAVAAITITGTIYGAGLKGQQEVKQQNRQILQATPEERIAQLEVARAELVVKKNEMERKMGQIAARRRAK